MAIGRYSGGQDEVPAVAGGPGGRLVLFCDELCRSDWCAEQPDVREGLEQTSAPVPLLCCSFCFCCGSRLNDPGLCVLHDGPCPVEKFAATSWAIEVCQLLLVRWASLEAVPARLLDVVELLWGSEGMDSPEVLATVAARTWMGYRDLS